MVLFRSIVIAKMENIMNKKLESIKEFLVKNPEFTAELVKMTAEEASKALKAKGFDVDSETMKILLEDIKKRVSDCSLTMGGGCLM